MEITAGIDVSKNTLDVCLLVPGRKAYEFQVPNTPAGQRELVAKVERKAGPSVHYCMEPSGAYHLGMAFLLLDKGVLVSVENPRRIKHHGIAIGAIQKTDRADARIIASYCLHLQPKAWRLASPEVRQLMLLDRRLCDILGMMNQEGNRLESEFLPDPVRKSIQRTLKVLKKEHVQIAAEMQRIIDGCPHLKRAYELLRSIPGIGDRAATGFLAEVGDIDVYEDAESLAASFGLNPLIRRSGTSIHGQTRISKMGNKHARCRFYMPALVATKHNPVIKAFYEKLLAKGKHKKSALLACCRKLVMLAYGVLRSGKPFEDRAEPLTT